jgi:hypothetical protein
MDIPTPQFFATLHCLLPVNGGARENWPRAGLWINTPTLHLSHFLLADLSMVL